MLTIIEDKPKLVLGAEKWQAAPFRFLDNLQVFEDSGDPGYELPNGYIKLKWVESDGTAYLNTGIYATVNTGARVKYEYTESGSAAILGVYHASPRDDALFISTNSGVLDTTNVFAAHGGATIQNGPVALNTEYTTSINFKGDGKIYVGNTVGPIGTTTPYNQYPILLGARYNAGNGNVTGSHSKIKIAEFTEGKVFSHRYIPCINPNGVAGYYDVVTRTFEGSSTSTPFIAGPVVLPDGYTQVASLTGLSGAASFGTGVLGGTDNIRIKFTALKDNPVAYSPFFGNYVNENTNCTRAIVGTGATGIIAEINRKAGNSTIVNTINTGVEHTYELYKEEGISILKVDGEIVEQMADSAGTENNNEIAINASNVRTTPVAGVATTYKGYFLIYISDELVRGYIPVVRDSDNIAGYYDIVHHRFNSSIFEDYPFTAGLII